MKKYRKLLNIISTRDQLWLRALRLGVAAGIEHTAMLKEMVCQTVVDVGANRGQFALAARHHSPDAKIFSFEPLPAPAKLFDRVFVGDSKVKLHNFAVGPKSEICTMQISGRDDSSSLLPISSLQEEIFPGTSVMETTDVQVAPLDVFVSEKEIVEPAILKLDVQGFEFEALQGCESLIGRFEWVYCECSFVELYSGQKLAADIIEWLANRGFRLIGTYNPSYDRQGISIQADLLFRRV